MGVGKKNSINGKVWVGGGENIIGGFFKGGKGWDSSSSSNNKCDNYNLIHPHDVNLSYINPNPHWLLFIHCHLLSFQPTSIFQSTQIHSSSIPMF